MHPSNSAHMHTLDYVQVEPEPEVQEKQVPEVFEGPQATSCMDTSIDFRSRQASVHLINALIFYFKTFLYVYFDCVLSL
jgi:hypothetical protein